MRKLKKSELKRVYGAKDGSEAANPANPGDTDIGDSTGGQDSGGDAGASASGGDSS